MRVIFFWSTLLLSPFDDEGPVYHWYDYKVARAHEMKPHRRTIPLADVSSGSNQLRLEVIVSPAGDVIDAHTKGEEIMKYWPQVLEEVRLWKFVPFKRFGKNVTAEVEEYVNVVPPERLPKNHVVAPVIQPDSKVKITLQRTGCYGSCPAYTVTIATDGIVFNGPGFVRAKRDPYGDRRPI